MPTGSRSGGLKSFGLAMNRDNRNAAIAALVIICVFGFGAYFLPTVMLAVGEHSTVAAALVGSAFVAAFFVLFWLRGKTKR